MTTHINSRPQAESPFVGSSPHRRCLCRLNMSDSLSLSTLIIKQRA